MEQPYTLAGGSSLDTYVWAFYPRSVRVDNFGGQQINVDLGDQIFPVAPWYQGVILPIRRHTQRVAATTTAVPGQTNVRAGLAAQLTYYDYDQPPNAGAPVVPSLNASIAGVFGAFADGVPGPKTSPSTGPTGPFTYTDPLPALNGLVVDVYGYSFVLTLNANNAMGVWWRANIALNGVVIDYFAGFSGATDFAQVSGSANTIALIGPSQVQRSFTRPVRIFAASPAQFTASVLTDNFGMSPFLTTGHLLSYTLNVQPATV